jgi:hypothetical protein
MTICLSIHFGKETIKNPDEKQTGLTHSGDFHHKMRKAGRHCEAAQPTKQSTE